MLRIAFALAVSVILSAILSGCGDSSSSTNSGTASVSGESAGSNSVPEQSEPEPIESESRRTRRGPISLGINASGGQDNAANKTRTGAKSGSPIESTFEALKPLQILMGQWEGKTRRAFGGFSAVDEPEWVWDFLTDRNQPALVMTSGQSPYFEQLRMSFDPKKNKFVMTAKHKDYGTREFEGEFIEEVKDVPGDNDKMQRTYELQFTQVASSDANDQWQFVVSQVDNNRYLIVMSRRRGSASFTQFDTIASQRQGTSFALSDTDYGEKTCIVSGGLGTSTVSYKGRMYYVCCSGCSAAFNEEPERWIAKALGEEKN